VKIFSNGRHSVESHRYLATNSRAVASSSSSEMI
jgi:hypothetical protein